MAIKDDEIQYLLAISHGIKSAQSSVCRSTISLSAVEPVSKHSWPQSSAGGSLHNLVLFLKPESHVAEQADGDHWPQLPSTIRKKIFPQ